MKGEWFAPFRLQQDDRFEVKCAESGRIRKQFSSMTVIMRAPMSVAIPARP